MQHELPQKMLSVRHMLGIEGLTLDDIQTILNTARVFDEVNTRDLKKVPYLRGKTVAHIFFESSTRTRISFDIAAKRLSADTIQLAGNSSSTQKGETLLDTVRNVEAMKPDIVVVRHAQSGASHLVAQTIEGAVVNAGDGCHEHPTQALLDAYTLLQHFRRTPQEGLSGMQVTIMGDILHSRVARSNMLCLKALGARVKVFGPFTMLPPFLDSYGVEICASLEEGIKDADAIMLLRIQKERLGSLLFPSEDEYFRLYGLTPQRFYQLKPDAVIMHPGPMNRGVEIASVVADGPRSLILKQAENGVPVRMAVLYCLARGLS